MPIFESRARLKIRAREQSRAKFCLKYPCITVKETHWVLFQLWERLTIAVLPQIIAQMSGTIFFEAEPERNLLRADALSR